MCKLFIYLFCLVQVVLWTQCSGAYTPPNYGEFDSYKPSRATTGHITPRSQLTAYNSPTDSVTLSTPNQTITSKIIYGVIIVKAPGVIIQDCLLVGPGNKPSSASAVVTCYDPTITDTIIRDCTIEPRFPNAQLDGIKGSGFKAYRNHIYWTVDGFGVFTVSGTTPTNVEIAGNLVEALVYFHGPYYSDVNSGLLLKTGGYEQYNSATPDAYVKRPADSVSDPDHRDGTHSDGVEVQGGYGAMIRGANGKWSGDGIYIHGNFFQNYEAEKTMQNPSGSSYPVPASLGTEDNPKRTVPQSPSTTNYNGVRMPDGKYPALGQALIVVQNVNQLQYPDAANPTKYTCVMQYNWLDDFAAAISFPAKVTRPVLNVAVLHNKIGPNMLVYSPSNPSTYPIRVSEGKKANFCPDVDGFPGLYTNVWDDPTNRWGRDGSALQPGRTSGIRYDDGYVPTAGPTRGPTVKATAPPTVRPTSAPTVRPTAAPTVKPTSPPTSPPTPSPTTAPTAEPVRCVVAANTWTSYALPSAQTGTFTFSYKLTTLLASDNAVFGLSNGVQPTYQGYSANARFDGVTQTIQAYQGSGGVGYKSDATVPYVPNKQYSFTFVVNLAAQTYSVQVQPEGGSAVTIASNYGLRVPVTSITHYGIIDSFAGSRAEYCQFKLNGLLL